MSDFKKPAEFVEILEDSQAIIDTIGKIEKKEKNWEKWQRISIRVIGLGILVSMLIADLMGIIRLACGESP